MRNWFLSLNGAITLSVIGFLTWLGRLFLDWKYEMRGSDTINVLWSVALVGGWVWAMLAAIRGSRRGLIACLIFALLLDLGFAFATFFFWCPPASCRGFPFISGLWRWTWAQLISGLLAVIALVLQLRQKQAAG
jgi:hypothetical protein